jgi:predicted transcriptional regulator
MLPEDNEIERLRRLIAGRPTLGDLNNHYNRHLLREWRIHRGLSQSELAERVGTFPRVVAEWEDESREIRMGDQFRLFRALEITPWQFFKGPSADR